MPKKRGLSSVDARIIRQRGHTNALEFALSIGLTRDYRNDLRAKKDVIDPSGDAHSVKSGEKKWQIFLYGINRFESDFAVMNGIGEILADCIKSFPPKFEDYQKDKRSAKERLRPNMVKLAQTLQNKTRLRVFLNKSIFNAGEVNYLTVKHKGIFHIFDREDVLKVFCDNLEVCNSRAISKNSFPEQKVLLRLNGINLGEIEMRNDSRGHYREVRFNMIIPRAMLLLLGKILVAKRYSHLVLVHGIAGKRFGRWTE